MSDEPTVTEIRRSWRTAVATGVLASLVTAAALLATSSAETEPAQNRSEKAKTEPAYSERNSLDPIATNGPIFVDWPKPDVALVFTGEQDGFLEPCGCAGLENQKGGLRRRMTLFNELREKGWPIVPMDLGNQEKRFGVQAQLKLDFSLRALAQMGYVAVGLGQQDLRMDLLPLVINLDEAANALVSANVGIVDFESGFTKRVKVVEAGGLRIGITAVLGKAELAQFQNPPDLTLLDPETALAEVLPTLRDARCDQLVLLAYAEPQEAMELARKFPDFDWVVTAHGAEEPPSEAKKIEGTKAHLIEVGHKGMYVAVVGLYKQGAGSGERGVASKKQGDNKRLFSYRYQRVPLDARFADAPEIDAMHVEYQQRLEALDLEGLGLKPVPHPGSGKFAGSQVCGDCHTSATEVYINTPHSHGTATLVNLKPPRQFDPECLSCHATGWEPQKYYPFQTGFLSTAKTPDLVGNGCENCHGPAAKHVAAETGEIEVSDKELEALRAALRLNILPNEGNKSGQVYDKGKVVQMCMRCHDLDNSPDFDFQTYWPKVSHPGKD